MRRDFNKMNLKIFLVDCIRGVFRLWCEVVGFGRFFEFRRGSLEFLEKSFRE